MTLHAHLCPEFLKTKFRKTNLKSKLECTLHIFCFACKYLHMQLSSDTSLNKINDVRMKQKLDTIFRVICYMESKKIAIDCGKNKQCLCSFFALEEYASWTLSVRVIKMFYMQRWIKNFRWIVLIVKTLLQQKKCFFFLEPLRPSKIQLLKREERI